MDGENARSNQPDGPPTYYAGHLFNPGEIRGQTVQVHMGDIHYATEGQQTRPSTVWQARPSLNHATSHPNDLYVVPRSSSFRSTGRYLETRQIEQFFQSPLPPTIGPRHKIAVLYGLGGSGKTEVCLRYAETSKAS